MLMRFLSGVLLLPFLVQSQTFLVYPLLGNPEPVKGRLNTTNLFYHDGLFDRRTTWGAWWNNDADVFARDLDYPESLSVTSIESDAGIVFLTRLGGFVLALGRHETQNRLLTSIENDSLILKSRSNFTNCKQRVLLQHSYWFLNNRLYTRASVMSAFGERDRFFFDLNTNLDVAFGLFASYYPLTSTELSLFAARDYYDKVLQIDVTGFMSDNLWLPHVSVVNAFTVYFRNYLSRNLLKLGVKHGFGNRLQMQGQWDWDSWETKAVFLLNEYAFVDLGRWQSRVALSYAISERLALAGRIAFGHAEGSADAKYQRANGSYSTLLADLFVKASQLGLELSPQWALSKDHVLSPCITFWKTDLHTPSEATLDPVKYFGAGYGAKKVTGVAAIQGLGVGTTYQWNRSWWAVEPCVRYLLSFMDGSLSMMDTWTLERDTVLCPLQRVHSLDFCVSGLFRFGSSFGLEGYVSQTLPVHVTWQGQPQGNGDAIQEPSAKRTTVSLLRLGVSLQYQMTNPGSKHLGLLRSKCNSSAATQATTGLLKKQPLFLDF